MQTEAELGAALLLKQRLLQCSLKQNWVLRYF